MGERTVWYVVADLTNPKAEPFAVLSADTSVVRESGVEGTVVSLHWSRDEAQRIADAFNDDSPPALDLVAKGERADAAKI